MTTENLLCSNNTYGPLKRFGYFGGTFTRKELEQSYKNNTPLTLDFSIPGNCLNNCYYCGYYNVNTEDKIEINEIYRVIDEFTKIGGKSIKILGEGEPLLRNDILGILGEISKNNLIPVLFTCGDVLGDEKLSKNIFNLSSENLVNILYDIGCTIVLKFEGFEQDEIVGRNGFSGKRNIALKLLLGAGFNKHYPSRLGFGIVLLKENFYKMKEIYRFSLSNNIYPLICPLMPIGKCKDKTFRENISPNRDKINILKEELEIVEKSFGIDFNGESDFPGGLPCDISRAGFYIDDVGDVFVCEADAKIGSIKDTHIGPIWSKINVFKTANYKERKLGLCNPKRCFGII
jgi:MoaA/NifB/PqqE/SkfB family radical SAM enzyme